MDQVARAFNLVFDLKLTTRGEMELAYQGEITTPSKCGRMDQVGWTRTLAIFHSTCCFMYICLQACAYGAVPVLMTFDADVLHIDTVSLPEGPLGMLHLVLVDLKASKDTTSILKSLQVQK
jgi:galactokinase